MGLLNNLILENNESVESMIKYLDSLIVKARTSGKLKEYPNVLKIIQDIYEDEILPFTRFRYLKGKELTKEHEERITNVILETISLLKDLQ